LLGPDIARDGLARLSGFPPGMLPEQARDAISTVGLLESTHFLRNQLLRDSDWASMGHSLELRTPLVDASLLKTLGPYVARFADGAGKAMLAKSPHRHLPISIVNRRKTGFSIPMERWLSKMQLQRPGIFPLPATLGTFWARRWARAVVADLAT